MNYPLLQLYTKLLILYIFIKSLTFTMYAYGHVQSQIVPSVCLRSHILTDESAEAETIIVLVALELSDTGRITAATAFTAPWWPSRTDKTFHCKHKMSPLVLALN